MRSRMTVRTAFLALALAVGLLPGAAGADEDISADPSASPNMDFVTNVPFEAREDFGESSRRSTDMDFATYRMNAAGRVLPPGARGGHEREFAFVGTYVDGLQVVDITDPENPEVATVYECAIAQSDVFIFEQGDRKLLAYTSDTIPGQTNVESRCHTDNGVDEDEYGTFLVDITDPLDPQSVSFIEYPRGTHQVTVHPSGEWIYSSPAALDYAPGQIDITDVSDPENPETVEPLELGTGLDSHDIEFNDDGTRAYSAALTHTLVIDTSEPGDPEIVGRIVDPAIQIHHEADPVTVTDELTGQEHTFLIVTDEIAGAAGNEVCPGGGLHVYDITGDLEANPVKVGAWFAPETGQAEGAGQGARGIDRCTAHVLEIHEDEQIMTIAWYALGTRVLDLSGLVGLSAGVQEGLGSVGTGMREVGYLHFDDSDVWAAKTPRIGEDGSFYVYAADTHRQLDVMRFDPDAETSEDSGRWMDPDQALAHSLSLQQQIDTDLRTEYQTSCLLVGARGAT